MKSPGSISYVHAFGFLGPCQSYSYLKHSEKYRPTAPTAECKGRNNASGWRRRPLRIQVSRTANKRAILNGDEQRMGASDGDDDMLARVSLPRPTHYPLISLSVLRTQFTCAYLFARSSRWMHEHIIGGVNVCRTLTLY